MAAAELRKSLVLVVAGKGADFELVGQFLRDADSEFELHHVSRIADATQRLVRDAFDVVLLNLDLLDSKGMTTLVTLHESCPSVPIVILAPSEDSAYAAESLKRGAHDWLIKGNLTGELLKRTLRYTISRHQLQDQLQDSERQLSMFAEQLPAMLWTTDQLLRITSCRGRELRQLHAHPERLKGRNITELFAAGRMSSTVGEMHRRALLGESTSADWEWRGRWFRAHVEPLTNHAKDIEGTIGLALDVTDERKLKKDVQAAHHVQQHLLPSRDPVYRGFDIAGKCFPAEDCSGDFFDYIGMPNGRLCIVLADVSGHGFGPAILAAAIRSYLRTAAVLGNQVHEMLALGNRLLHSDGDLTPFASVFAVSFNLEERTFRFASAGHPAYLIRSGGEATKLESMSVPIGVRRDEQFTLSSRIRFRPGDILLLVSDGVFEARSAQGEYFGVERAMSMVLTNRDEKSVTIVQRLHDAAMNFSEGRTLEDDLTAVVVKSTEISEAGRETWKSD
jgi:PAS domain S-box-containing protein